MIRLNIRTPGIKSTISKLNKTQRRQVPFALANTINDILFEARKAEAESMDKHLHKPSGWTKRGLRVEKASKRRLTGALFIPDDRWKYLRYQVEGGTSGDMHSVPVGAKTRASGSLGRGGVSRLLNRKNVKIMRFKGKSGVYQVTKGGGVKLLVHFASKASYRARFPFGKATERLVDRRAETLMKRNLERALRTVR